MKSIALVVFTIALVVFTIALVFAGTLPDAAQVAPGLDSFAPQGRAPAWSRGIQYLPISFDECSGRARRALEAEGFTVENGGSSFSGDQYFAGSKDGYCAAIACNASPTGRTWANVFVGSLSGGDVAGTQRERLQTQMGRPVTVSGVCGLGTRWDEEEAGWRSVWTRRGTSNVFDASYTGPDGKQAATVNVVTIEGNHISIKRTSSSDGYGCNYEGTVQSDGVTISGTYSCGSGGWRATINCNH